MLDASFSKNKIKNNFKIKGVLIQVMIKLQIPEISLPSGPSGISNLEPSLATV